MAGHDGGFRRFITALIGLAMLAPAHPAHALDAGQYEVSVRLELPHVEDSGAAKTAVLCIAYGQDNAHGSTHGLKVLSDNNPLGNCPASEVQESDGTLKFRIVCPGGNAAIASAVYQISSTMFTGVITMKMGGKNMTMTERQSGRRVGDCRADRTPRS